MASVFNGPWLSLEQIAQVAYMAGARGSDLEFLTSVPPGESWDKNRGLAAAAAHRSNHDFSAMSGDRGLWQINYIWDNELKGAGIINSPQDLFDPMTNAKAALYILGKQGRGAWSRSAGGHNVAGAQQAVRSAGAKGMLGADWQTGGSSGDPGGWSSGAGGAGGIGGTGASGVLSKLPADALLVAVDNGPPVAMFKVADGVWIRYDNVGPAALSKHISRYDRATFDKWFGRAIRGGLAVELENIPGGFNTFKQYWDTILDQVLGKNNPARNDPGVLRTVAEFAARPDMTEAEFENKMQGTEWFQQRTQKQLEWNSLSDAERRVRREETAARMAETWREYTGQNVGPGNGHFKHLVESVASGAVGFGAWIASSVKPHALKIAQSPWSRTVRDEAEEQRKRGVDIANTAQRVRDASRRWGLNFNERQITDWATGLVRKTKSDKDLVDYMSKQAKALYPWLPKGMETIDAAQPWIQTYNRLMETESNLYTSMVQQALANQEALPDFEARIKRSGNWMKTANAREETFSMMNQVGDMFGHHGTG